MKKFRQTLFWFYSLTTLADRIILSFALILLIWLYMHYWVNDPYQPASYALIKIPHQAPIKIDLQSPQQFSIQGHLGKSFIEVANKGIRFTASPCRYQQCIRAGWLTKKGDFTVCLPNRISIELHDRLETIKYDAIVY